METVSVKQWWMSVAYVMEVTLDCLPILQRMPVVSATAITPPAMVAMVSSIAV